MNSCHFTFIFRISTSISRCLFLFNKVGCRANKHTHIQIRLNRNGKREIPCYATPLYWYNRIGFCRNKQSNSSIDDSVNGYNRKRNCTGGGQREIIEGSCTRLHCLFFIIAFVFSIFLSRSIHFVAYGSKYQISISALFASVNQTESA